MKAGQATASAARWALGLLVVLSVLGMHSLLGAPPAAEAHPDPVGAVQAVAVEVHPGAAPSAGAETEPGACSGRCGGHGGPDLHSLAHLCLAVLVGVVGLLVARLLVRAHPGPARSPARRLSNAHPDRRVPPWTQPTLAQLSVLRV